MVGWLFAAYIYLLLFSYLCVVGWLFAAYIYSCLFSYLFMVGWLFAAYIYFLLFSYLCVVGWLFAGCLGPWAGWLAACNSLNTIKFEVIFPFLLTKFC